MEIEILTPIEKYNHILLKREDKLILNNVNGGKIRQIDSLFKKYMVIIKNKFNNQIVFSAGINSNFISIISTLSNHYKFKTAILTYKTNKLNINLTIAQQEGVNIYGFNVGYQNVLNKYAKDYFKNYFNINSYLEITEEVAFANINQVENLPDDLDYLIVPVGSGLNFISIIKGLIKFNKKPKNVIGIQVGKNPNLLLKKYLYGCKTNYKIIEYPLNYNKPIKDYSLFDEFYEAKAYDWIIKNLPLNKKILLWIVGKRNLEVKPEKINFKEIDLEKNQKLVF